MATSDLIDDRTEAVIAPRSDSSSPRTNYVLIDYENVQPASLDGLDAEHFRVVVFVGASQNKLAFEMAAALQRLGPRAEYVKITGNGHNASDFHIACYLGLLAAREPHAYFHVISKDTGFDALIQHLRERKIFAARCPEVAEIPLLKIADTQSLPDRVALVVANLRQRGESKPRTIKSLANTISTLFHKKLADREIASVIKGLQARRFITVTATEVSYSLPTGETL